MDTWAPMELLRSLESTIREMEHGQFGMHGKYLDYVASAPGNTRNPTRPDEPHQNLLQEEAKCSAGNQSRTIPLAPDPSILPCYWE
jgi:hypothetical protein